MTSPTSRTRINAKRTGDKAADDALIALGADITEALQTPLLDARFVEVAAQNGYLDGTFSRRFNYATPSTLDVALKAGVGNVLPHRLGRAARGYVVVARDANAAVWNVGAVNADSKTITLNCSADVTVRLVVF